MAKHTLEEMLNAYWLDHLEVGERVNLVLAERGQKYIHKRGNDTVIDIATGQVLEDDVMLWLLARQLDVIKDGEIYEEPPDGCWVDDGRLRCPKGYGEFYINV
jgi:hypothetical protein